MEETLIDLQTRLAFQEDHIRDLNDMVARQGKELEELRLDLAELKRQLRALTPSDIAGEAEETPPPHY